MLILNILLLTIFLVLFIYTRSYEKQFLHTMNQKEHPLKLLYPFALYIMDRNPFAKRLQGYRDYKYFDYLKELYIGEPIESIKKLYMCNKIANVIMILLVSNILSMVSIIQVSNKSNLLEGGYIARPNYMEGSKEVDLNVLVQDNESAIEDNVLITIEERILDEEEVGKLFEFGIEMLEKSFLGTNSSNNRIESNLDFLTIIPNTTIKVSWYTTHPNIIDEKGRVWNEDIVENILVEVFANLTYRNHKAVYSQYVNVVPKAYTHHELIRKQLSLLVENIGDSSNSRDNIKLPEKLGEYNLFWYEKVNSNGQILLILGIISAIFVALLMDKELTKKVEKKNKQMLLDYPDIINKFNLLVGAGMSISNAWGHIVNEYETKTCEKKYAYEEMLITHKEISLGTSEGIAYERFGRRVKLLPYLRFSALIGQNLKKGTKDLLEQLELEVADAFIERKELAKRLGEEAGTKLLLPMVIMLVLVIAIIMVPAFMSFQL